MPPTQPTSRRGTFVDMGTTNDIPDEPTELHLTTHDGGWLRDGVTPAEMIDLSSRDDETS